MADSSSRKLIRNSTAEFLIFTAQEGAETIEARYDDGTIWLSQRLMSELFDTSQQNISLRLQSVFCGRRAQLRINLQGFLVSSN